MPASVRIGVLLLEPTALDIAPAIFLRFVNPMIQLRYALLAWSEAPERPPLPMRNLPCMYPNLRLRSSARNLRRPKQLRGDLR
jgi:hypothetical protein